MSIKAAEFLQMKRVDSLLKKIRPGQLESVQESISRFQTLSQIEQFLESIINAPMISDDDLEKQGWIHPAKSQFLVEGHKRSCELERKIERASKALLSLKDTLNDIPETADNLKVLTVMNLLANLLDSDDDQ